MIRVVLTDGSYTDVAEAIDAERRGHEIILAGVTGQVVARFECTALIAYGPPETLPGDPMRHQFVTYRRSESTCLHTWNRLRGLEEVLDVVVFVRECSQCGCVEAKPGHRDPLADDMWVPIATQR